MLPGMIETYFFLLSLFVSLNSILVREKNNGTFRSLKLEEVLFFFTNHQKINQMQVII